jgi:glycosyltransferase involved in cell wall biosynthesis
VERGLRNMGKGSRKVVWLIDSLKLGGAERLTVDLARGADPGRAKVSVVTIHEVEQGTRALEDELRAHGVEVVGLRARNLRDAEGYERLVKTLERLRPDVIHAHLRYATIWGGAAAKRMGIPAVATLHTLPPPRTTMREFTLGPIELWSLNHRFTKVIAVSEAQAHRWRAAGVRPHLLRVIPNGVPPLRASAEERAEARAELGIAADEFLFLTVAVVRRLKGWEFLLRAAPRIVAEYPQTKFAWVGDGPDGERFRQAVGASPYRGHFLLPGMQADVSRWLRAADAFLFPSLEEALPTAVIEAMAAGLPIISTELPAVREVVGPQIECVTPGDSVALGARAVLFPDNDKLCREIGERGWRRYLERFSAEAWRERLYSLYDEVGSPAGASAGAATVKANAPSVRMVEFFSRGGLFHYSLQLARAIANEGCDVRLLTGRAPEIAEPDETNRVTVEAVLPTWDPKKTRARWASRPVRYAHGAAYLRAWIKLLREARRRPTDVLLFSDLEHRCDAWFIRLLKRRGQRLAVVWHNVEAFDRTSSDTSRVLREESWRTQMSREFDWVFVHGRELAGRLKAKAGIEPYTIPHGNQGLMADEAGPDPDLRKKLQIPTGSAVALLFGTLTKYKGIDVLLQALALVPKAVRPVAVIAGFATDDVHPERLRAFARELRVEDSVRWDVRYVPVEEVAWYFRLADFVVLPYRAASQSGVAHLALTFGKPLIVTRTGALPEIVEDGRNGWVVPPEDAAALAAALTEMSISTSRDEMGPHAQEVARSLDWSGIARRIVAVFKDGPRRPECAASADTSVAA